MCPVAQQSEALWGKMGSCEFQAITWCKCSVEFHLVLFLSQHQHWCGNVFCLKTETWGHVELALPRWKRRCNVFHPIKSFSVGVKHHPSKRISQNKITDLYQESIIPRDFPQFPGFLLFTQTVFLFGKIGNGEPCTVTVRVGAGIPRLESLQFGASFRKVEKASTVLWVGAQELERVALSNLGCSVVLSICEWLRPWWIREFQNGFGWRRF